MSRVVKAVLLVSGCVIIYAAGYATGGGSGSTNTPTAIKTVIETHKEVEVPTVEETEEPAPSGFSAGVYQVGVDIKAGKYRTGNPGGDTCYYAKLANLDGGLDSILANNNIEGPGIMSVSKGDSFIEFTGNCVWDKA